MGNCGLVRHYLPLRRRTVLVSLSMVAYIPSIGARGEGPRPLTPPHSLHQETHPNARLPRELKCRPSIRLRTDDAFDSDTLTDGSCGVLCRSQRGCYVRSVQVVC